MKRFRWVLLLSLAQCGCSAHRISVVPRPDGLHYPSIFAAAAVNPARDRAAILCSIAGRNNLTPSEQIYLLDVLEDCGGTSNQKALILLELLRNPALTNATRSRVAEILPGLNLQPKHSSEVAFLLASQH